MKKIRFSRKYPFNGNYLIRIPNSHGVYVLSYRETIIYVGLAREQFIRKRLLKHFNTSLTQNDTLRSWLKSKHTKTSFQYKCHNQSQILELEEYCIVMLQPLANYKLHKQKNIENNGYSGYRIEI